MDKIFIHGLKIAAIIGVYAKERKQKQPLILDLEIQTDIRKAAASDDIKDTLNYVTIAKRIEEIAENNPCYLLEALAEKIATMLFHEFPIKSLELKINKPLALYLNNVDAVGVIIYRTNS